MPIADLRIGNEKAPDVARYIAGMLGGRPNRSDLLRTFDNIQAGTTYANRAAGATTGAWPGVQVFGGWKGSGSSGKGIGGLYTLALYMHEQSRTIIG